MSVKEIASILAIEISDIEKSIEKVANTLADAGLNLINNNDKLLVTTSSEYSDVIKSFYSYTVTSDLTPAQLQTLTIIAYLASATVSQISFVRGVQSLQTVRALSTRGLIEKDRRVSTEDIETISKDNYMLSLEAFKYLGVSSNAELKDFEILQAKLKTKMNEALNG